MDKAGAGMNRYEKRKKYIKSYVQDVQGNWRYIGQWYTPRDIEAHGAAYRRTFLLHILFTAIGTIAVGFLPAGPMLGGRAEGLNYVMLCYSLQFMFAVAAVWTGTQILRNKLCLEEYDIRYISRLQGFTAACGAFAAAAAIAGIIDTVISGRPDELVWNLLLIAVSAGVSVVNLLFFQFLKKIPWEIRENH